MQRNGFTPQRPENRAREQRPEKVNKSSCIFRYSKPDISANTATRQHRKTPSRKLPPPTARAGAACMTSHEKGLYLCRSTPYTNLLPAAGIQEQYYSSKHIHHHGTHRQQAIRHNRAADEKGSKNNGKR